MAVKFIFLPLLVIIVNAEAHAPVAAPILSDATFDPVPQYYFGYDVQDALTGDSKSQVETRNGEVVLGQYSLNDPDGTRRIVDYSSDINGFNAVVRKAPLAIATPVVAAAALTPVVEPAVIREVAAPLVEARALPVQPSALLRSFPTSAKDGSPRAGQSASPSLSRSAQPSSAPLSSTPAPSFFGIVRSGNPLSPSNPSPGAAESTSASQVRSGPSSLRSVPRTASTVALGRENVQAKSAPLEASSPVAVRSAQVAPAASLTYAAAPAFTYLGAGAPIAYNIW